MPHFLNLRDKIFPFSATLLIGQFYGPLLLCIFLYAATWMPYYCYQMLTIPLTAHFTYWKNPTEKVLTDLLCMLLKWLLCFLCILSN